MFLRGKTSSRLSIHKVAKEVGDFFDICKTGFPSLVRQGLTSVSTMFLNNCAESYGDAAIAAMSIVNRICFFTFATSLGIGQGFQPVCAFNYGARKYDRVKKAFLFTMVIGEILLGSAAIIGMGFADTLVGIFRDDGEVIRIGTVALIAQFAGQVFQPVAVCTNMMYQSTGQAGTATFLSMLRSGLYFMPTLLILSALLGLTGVQLAQGISDVLTAVTAIPFAVFFLKKLTRFQNEN